MITAGVVVARRRRAARAPPARTGSADWSRVGNRVRDPPRRCRRRRRGHGARPARRARRRPARPARGQLDGVVAADPRRRDDRPRGWARPRRGAGRTGVERHPAARRHLRADVLGRPDGGPGLRPDLPRRLPGAGRSRTRAARCWSGRGRAAVFLWMARGAARGHAHPGAQRLRRRSVLATGAVVAAVAWLGRSRTAGRLRRRPRVVPAFRRLAVGARAAAGGHRRPARSAASPTPTPWPGSPASRPECGRRCSGCWRRWR